MDFSSIDSIIEFLKSIKGLLSGMGLGSVVSWLTSKYSSKKKIAKITSDDFIVFKNDADPAFVIRVCSSIEGSERDITFVGLGHTILRHNDAIKSSLLNAVTTNPNINLSIYYSSAEDGLQSRLREEKTHYANKFMNYDENWIHEYPANIVAFLTSSLSDQQLDQVLVKRLTYMPMFNLVRVDNSYFFYVYGCPSIRGPDSPWIFISPDSKSQMKSFFDRNLAFARANCGANLLTTALSKP